MTVKKIQTPFQNLMSRRQAILGWIYLPVHLVVLPLLMGLYAQVAPTPVTEVQINLFYLGVGLLAVLCVMLRYLRRSFDVLVDRPGYCLLTMLLTLAVLYAMNYAATLLLLLLGGLADNPNNEYIMDMAAENTGAVLGLTIFIAPIVEEVLFRGVVFGSLRNRSRLLAYAVSVLLFSLSHTWQYAVVAGDLSVLIYTLQYIPISIALAWLYERSGTIWTCIFFHTGFNALSFYALRLLDSLGL